jgi:hypothetical protein
MTTDLTPEHTARNQGDDKELHPEVLAAYRYVESVHDSADMPSNDLVGPRWFGWALREAFLAGCSHVARARAALDEPAPEGLLLEPRGCPTPGAYSCPTSPTAPLEVIRALELAEAALADIGDADREPGDDLAWAEARAAQDLPRIRAVLKRLKELEAQ